MTEKLLELDLRSNSRFQSFDEVDAAIAEYILGWEPLTGNQIPARDRAVTFPHRRCIWYKGDTRMACDECGTLPRFSREIGPAWEVVRALWSSASLIAYAKDALTDEGGYWVSFDGSALFSGFSPSVPFAICKAALKLKSRWSSVW